jgi:hypothetical protein
MTYPNSRRTDAAKPQASRIEERSSSMAKRRNVTFKVWLEIERYDEGTDRSETMDAPGASLAAFETYDEAWDYAERATQLAEAIIV